MKPSIQMLIYSPTKIYKNYIRSVIQMEIAAELTTMQIEYISRMAKAQMKREARRLNKGAYHEKPVY